MAAKTASAPKSNKGVMNTIKPFACGGLGGMFATTCVQPIDMVKVRIQLTGEGGSRTVRNPFVVAKQIIKNEGVGALYKGLPAGLLRQATYTTTRMGLYRSFVTSLAEPGKPLPLWKSASCALTAGAIGAVVGTPADLVLLRMQSDSTLPASMRRNYKGLGDAFVRIVKEEGAMGLFTGCAPVVYRAMALNMGMLATYDYSKHTFSSVIGAGPLANFGASALSGFIASAFTIPFDFVKTRIQRQKPRADGTLMYRGTFHAFKTVLQAEGPFAFYKGFLTFYMRIAPHSMIVLLGTDVFVQLWNQTLGA